MEYSVRSDESEEDNTYLSYNKVIGTSLDRELYLAFQVWTILLSAPGTPLKERRLWMPVSEKILWDRMTMEFISQFSRCAKNANLEQKKSFFLLLERTLSES